MITFGTPQDSELTMKRGEKIAFSVVVNMNTPAMVRWFFNAAPLRSSANRRVEINNEDNSNFKADKLWTQDLDASMLINNITCEDTGFYQVEISNPVNTTLVTYKLIVEDCK